MRLATIDPGTKEIGIAFWGPSGRLWEVIVTRGATVAAHAAEIRRFVPSGKWGRVVVEEMEWRPDDPKSQPKSLIKVSAMSAAVAGTLSADVSWVRVCDWKGTIPKRIHHPRIKRVLDKDETKVLGKALERIPKGHHKEALDAIGIGLVTLGRMDKAGRSTKR